MHVYDVVINSTDQQIHQPWSLLIMSLRLSSSVLKERILIIGSGVLGPGFIPPN
ncbi:hypothetical protein M8C21_014545 [Ambrosia artemisiifolia]|uniref:Uncharacterized protein n=1 Tax=Ambrosia artemisiifolia TaxID=4212 RepID=A0AAD5CA42_AMBAR|nr:hypothetical protein M8C21_014545 [Ambrosia artemisiifolia]